jgi:hypothetical protein
MTAANCGPSTAALSPPVSPECRLIVITVPNRRTQFRMRGGCDARQPCNSGLALRLGSAALRAGAPIESEVH